MLSETPSKLRTAVAGLVVVSIVGLATPAVLGGVTVGLWTHSAPFDAHGAAFLGLLALGAVAWMAWLRISVGLCLDVASGLRQPNGVQRLGGLRGYLAGRVLGFALLVLPASAIGAGAAGAISPPVPISATLPAAIERVTASSTPATLSFASSNSDSASSNVTPAAAATYTVEAGDCLSTIALRFYGDEGAWNEIWAANADRVMAGGERFVDPNLIYAGWQLTLPGVPASRSATPGQSSAAVPPTSRAPRPSAPSPTDEQSGPGEPSTGGSAPSGRSQGAQNAVRSVRDQRGGADPPALRGGDAGAGVLVRWVPESAALGLSTLVAAAYLRRLRRRRAQYRAMRADDEVLADPEPLAVTLEARLAPFADAPVLGWLELANRHLTQSLRAADKADLAPRIKLVRVGPQGVDLFLETPVDWSPGSFTTGEDGQIWRLPAGVDREILWPEASGELAWLPLLLPLGDDGSGTYLLHVEPGQEVSLEGPQAPSMLAAWVQAAKSWPWAEQVSVARNAESAEVLAPLFVGQGTLDERATLFFAGDPESLPDAVRSIIASVSSKADHASVRVTADAHRALIEPFDITVRPCGLDPAAEDVLEGSETPRLLPIRAEPRREPAGLTEQMRGNNSRDSSGIVLPGPIEVRLLTFTPNIVGLTTPLPSNRAVRITELVSWLALQGTKGSTSTAMLEHSIVGATTTKTLYNIVSAARLALGTDASGASRLVSDRVTGIYRLAEEVTVDVLRFMHMAEHGVNSDDPQIEAELCEAALNLIEDTPIGNGSGRYGWWSSLWEARIGRLATKAAGCLAELARNEMIDIEVARRGIEAARFTAGGEEELHRVAMVLEAWAGNHTRVEQEWAIATAQADDAASGSAPTTSTERLVVASRKRRP